MSDYTRRDVLGALGLTALGGTGTKLLDGNEKTAVSASDECETTTEAKIDLGYPIHQNGEKYEPFNGDNEPLIDDELPFRLGNTKNGTQQAAEEVAEASPFLDSEKVMSVYYEDTEAGNHKYVNHIILPTTEDANFADITSYLDHDNLTTLENAFLPTYTELLQTTLQPDDNLANLEDIVLEPIDYESKKNTTPIPSDASRITEIDYVISGATEGKAAVELTENAIRDAYRAVQHDPEAIANEQTRNVVEDNLHFYMD